MFNPSAHPDKQDQNRSRNSQGKIRPGRKEAQTAQSIRDQKDDRAGNNIEKDDLSVQDINQDGM